MDPEGLAFSLDDGHIWNFIEGSPAGVRSLVVNPANANYLYAATESGVARSINGGNDWLPSSDGLPDSPADWVSATPNALFTSAAGRLYRSGLGMPVWQDVITPPASGRLRARWDGCWPGPRWRKNSGAGRRSTRSTRRW